MAKRSKGQTLEERIIAINISSNREMLKKMLDGNIAVEKLLFDCVGKIAKAGERTGFHSDDAEFLLKNYPAQAKQVETALAALHDSLVETIQSNTEAAWLAAEDKNDAIVDAITQATGLSKEQMKQYYYRNTEAMSAAIKRADKGFNLSQNVWQLTDELRGEMELALDIALGEGKSAAALATQMKKYLRDPDKLFRRVRDKHGALKLSKNAAAYHPGRGRYRSSYKNALRMTATEANIAYRTADYERWQRMDFVQGIEIRPSSTNHPEVDICDELQGIYPKDFKWTGWHPFCRCNAVPKMEDFDSFLAKQQEYIDNGTKPDYSDGEVTEVPKNFTRWVKDNEERIAGASSLPYFLADNGKVSRGKYKLMLSNAVQMKQQK